jgi:hypothetical protein
MKALDFLRLSDQQAMQAGMILPAVQILSSG